MLPHHSPALPWPALLWPNSLSLLFLALSACSKPEVPVNTQGEAAFLRLSLQRETQVSIDEPRRIAHFQVTPENQKEWITSAPEVLYKRIPPEDARIAEAKAAGKRPKGLNAIILTGKRPAPMSVRVPCNLPANTLNQVAVNLRNYGRVAEMISITLHAEGKIVARSPWVAFKGRGGLRLTHAQFPELRLSGVTLDGIGLETKGLSAMVALTHIDALFTPLEEFLPALEGRGEMIAVGEQDRRCVGLTSQSALITELLVPDQADLFYTFALQGGLATPRAPGTLHLRVEAEGIEPLTRSHLLGAKYQRQFGQERIDLGRFANKRTRIRFELESGNERKSFCAVGEVAVSRRSRQAKTVLLVTSDTHRADHMGQAEAVGGNPAGAELVKTPHLDALGDRGVYFSKAFASTNVTNPSHVALMTGTTPRDTRILNNSTRLVDQATTLAEAFQEGGYRTCAVISAYHLLDSESGLGQGFDRVNGPRKNDRDGELSVNILEEWVAEAAGQPLFVWLHLFDAHAPYGAPKPFDERYWEGAAPFDPAATPPLPRAVIPPFLTGLTDLDYPYQQYRGEVDYVDVQMGRVLAIERMADAIIAFTADHGEAFGEHGIWWDHADLYPQTVQVPLVLAWPGGPTGVRSGEFVQQIDVGRTLLDLAGFENTPFPGRNLRWALDDYPAADTLYELSAHGNVASTQNGTWRLNLHLRNHSESAIEEPRAKHTVEFYNTAVDPLCENDLALAEEHYEQAKRMRADLIRWLEAADPQGWGMSQVMTLEALESLEAMGYGGHETGTIAQGALYEEDPENHWCHRFSR